MMKSINKSKGFTLIEYMVAITIGLILLAGVGTFFLGMQKSSQAQNGISELQENGRFALYFLTNEIQMAGWKEPDFIIGASTPNYIDLAGTSDGGAANASDSLQIRYESDFDCLGNAAAGGIATNRFFVEDGQLKCGAGGASQPIISGVEVAHFLYGVDTDRDNTPEKYVTATQLTANPVEARQVVSVKAILLLASDTNVADTNSAKTFTILGEGEFTTSNDRKLRKIFSTTIFLPNRPKYLGS
ncbi:MAG: PilW family protein [Kangiella sp.]|nr:PilW family protein [Kangiella sp.]